MPSPIICPMPFTMPPEVDASSTVSKRWVGE
jgi:hypothetical protein